jgi:dihydrofolate reductase
LSGNKVRGGGLSSLGKYIIVAMTRSRVIGKENKMPWHLPEDLKLFKKITSGNTVIMGRKTYESIGRPLPNRQNIVITSGQVNIEGALVCRTITEALDKADQYGHKIFFIGGAKLYMSALELVDYMYVSWLKQEYEGDAYFPEFDVNDWEKMEETDYPEFTNILYKRIRN